MGLRCPSLRSFSGIRWTCVSPVPTEVDRVRWTDRTKPSAGGEAESNELNILFIWWVSLCVSYIEVDIKHYGDCAIYFETTTVILF